MTTARELLSNIQSECSLLLTVNGKTYADRYPVGGGDVSVKINTPLIYTVAMPSSFGSSVRDVVGSIGLRSVSVDTLAAEKALSWRNKPYQFEVCGILNKGLATEQVIDFDSRLPLLNGLTTNAPFGTDSFLIALGSDESAMKRTLLDSTIANGDEVLAADFNFSESSSTLVQSDGDIDVDISITNTTSNGQTITFTFDQAITELALALEAGGALATHSSFYFAQNGSNALQSTAGSGMLVDVAMETNGSTTKTITLDFDKPVDEVDAVLRAFNVETIDSWSHTPDSITPALPHSSQGENSTVKWTGLGGVKQITFTVSGLPSGSTLVDDGGGRPYITSAVKFWLTRVVESKAFASGLSFSQSPTIEPSGGSGGGSYRWDNFTGTSMTLSATFEGVSGGDPLGFVLDGNKVTIENEDSTLKIVLNRVYKDSADDPSKIQLRPLAIGENLRSVGPASLGGTEYDLGGNVSSVAAVYNNGQAVVEAANQTEFDTNHGSGTVSYLFDAGSGKLQVSGEVGTITATVATPESTFEELIEHLANIAQVSVGVVEPEFAGEAAQLWLDGSKQYTLRTALDELLAPMDCFPYFEDGELNIAARKSYSTDYDVELSLETDVVLSSLKFESELPVFYKYSVGYDRTWVVQDTPELRNEYKRVENVDESLHYEDYPTNSILSEAEELEVNTCFLTATPAQKIADKRADRARYQKTFQMYCKKPWQLERNQRLGISGYPGMFLIERLTENTATGQPYVQGTYYE